MTKTELNKIEKGDYFYKSIFGNVYTYIFYSVYSPYSDDFICVNLLTGSIEGILEKMLINNCYLTKKEAYEKALLYYKNCALDMKYKLKKLEDEQ